MSRPLLELADLVRTAGVAFLWRNRQWIRWTHIKVLLAIARCRTAALGGHVDQCTRCGHRAISYNSCRNRHCPKCQTAARERWIAARRTELLPTRYLHVVFTLPHELAPLALQNKKILYHLLLQTSAQTLLEVARDPKHLGAELRFQGDLKPLAQPKAFAAWLRPLYRQDWVVYLKRPFGGPHYVLQYLGRYTHRVAISNHRLVSFTDGQVTFRWRDSAHQNEQKFLPLSLDEFLRRFLLHLLPKGFVRIRNFGFLANRNRATLLPLCFQLLGAVAPPPTEPEASRVQPASPLWLCPQCGGPMAVLERLTAAELQLRSPPLVARAAACNYHS